MNLADTSAHAWALLTKDLTERQKEVLDRLRYFPGLHEYGIGGLHGLDGEPCYRKGWGVARDRSSHGRRKRPCKITKGMSHAWRAKHPVLPSAFKEEPKVETAKTPLGI